ncbi:MAG: hypothetical protein HY002_22305 [Candidatus Rokubacteria bacterium]|nr:hypothetical protein [Candidatus Rokubacteria bacterium]
MRPTLRKLEVKDLSEVQKLVTESAESIEPGLKIIGSHALLGDAQMDLVGVDSKNSLALAALGLTANEEMLLRALDAYSWCLDFPETVQRLYPRSRFHPRAPRVLFVAERMPDSFLRKVRQVNFAELDCLTFLQLEVNGTRAVYFDTVERIRRMPEPPLAEGGPVVSPQLIEQHPFIEGVPPGHLWDDPHEEAAWKARPAAPANFVGEASAPAAAGEPYPGQWQELTDKLGAMSGSADALDPALLRPSPEAGPSPNEATPPTASGAGADGFEQYKGEWREFLERLGASQLPDNHELPGDSRGLADTYGSSAE